MMVLWSLIMLKHLICYRYLYWQVILLALWSHYRQEPHTVPQTQQYYLVNETEELQHSGHFTDCDTNQMH